MYTYFAISKKFFSWVNYDSKVKYIASREIETKKFIRVKSGERKRRNL